MFEPSRCCPPRNRFTGTEGTAVGLLVPYAGTFRTLADSPAIGAVLSLAPLPRRRDRPVVVPAGAGNPFLLSRTRS